MRFPVIPCFLLKPTAEVLQTAVVIAPGCGDEFHRAEFRIRTEAQDGAGCKITITDADIDALPEIVVCDNCGEEFSRQAGSTSKGAGRRWLNTVTGEMRDRIDSWPPGAVWFADWYRNDATGLYGWEWDNQLTPPLMVKTPGGDWDIDSRANNCTMPQDRLHRCWVRHGDPPLVTVDKIGLTCGAGAGSIQCGSYHGFLIGGNLT